MCPFLSSDGRHGLPNGLWWRLDAPGVLRLHYQLSDYCLFVLTLLQLLEYFCVDLHWELWYGILVEESAAEAAR